MHMYVYMHVCLCINRWANSKAKNTENNNLGFHNLHIILPCRVGSVVSVSASRTVGRAFASRPGHTKDHHKNGTNCLPAWHALREGRSLTVQPDCLKCRVVCGTVYGDMDLKDLLGSIVRVGYRIPVPDFYLVLHDIRCRKSTIMD